MRVVAMVGVGVSAIVAAIPVSVSMAEASPSSDGGVVFEFADPDIIESSGLAVRDGLFATVNDSGDRARTFVVDPESGETVGGVDFGEAVDIEALAPAPDGTLWVADIGGNNEPRTQVDLARVPFDAAPSTDVLETRTLSYPDDGRGGRDAEALLAHPQTGELVLVDKEAPASTVYLDAAGDGALEPVGEVIQTVTDGAFFPSGRHIIVRNYVQAAVYSWPDLEVVDTFFLPLQPQGEGIAVDEEGEVFISTEGEFTPVQRVALPDSVAGAVLGIEPTAPTRSSDPSESADPPVGPGDDPSPTTGAEDADQESDSSDDESGARWVWLIGGGVLLALLAIAVAWLQRRSTT